MRIKTPHKQQQHCYSNNKYSQFSDPVAVINVTREKFSFLSASANLNEIHRFWWLASEIRCVGPGQTRVSGCIKKGVLVFKTETCPLSKILTVQRGTSHKAPLTVQQYLQIHTSWHLFYFIWDKAKKNKSNFLPIERKSLQTEKKTLMLDDGMIT